MNTDPDINMLKWRDKTCQVTAVEILITTICSSAVQEVVVKGSPCISPTTHTTRSRVVSSKHYVMKDLSTESVDSSSRG